MKMETYSEIELVAVRFVWDKTHMILPIRRHKIWNIELFFMSYDLTIKIANLFSLSCFLWCSMARWNEYVSDVSIPVATWSKTWVWGGLGFRIPLRAWRPLFCEFCVLSEFSASCWSLVRSCPTACALSECDIKTPCKKTLLTKYWPKRLRKRKIKIHDWALKVKKPLKLTIIMNSWI